MLPYALTIFTGAFLVFQIQPVIAKYILPWFGGAPAVWTTAMLFFQVFLLGGYAYAHLSVRRFSPRTQVVVHLVFLGLALTQLPITPASGWKPESPDFPSLRILALLTASIGLPYMVLASTAPLLQAWFSRNHPGVSPYRLYALSNLGSMLALLSYPFLVEPVLTRTAQVTVWGVGFGIFVAASAYCATLMWRRKPGEEEAIAVDEPAPEAAPPSAALRVLWLALAATAVVMLLAITNQITQDVGPVPFLWVLPLSLYLLTFIIAFDNERWYSRRVFAPALIPTMVAAVWIMFLGQYAPLMLQIGGYSAVLFVCCMVCHGELSRLKPHPRHLTGYFLLIATGGALGGVFVTFVAPLIFSDYLELHIGLLAVTGLALVVFFVDRKSLLYRGRPVWAAVALMVTFAGLGAALSVEANTSLGTTVAKSRNFYGVLTVGQEYTRTTQEQRWLRNGASYHGVQFMAPAKRRFATGYYSVRSGGGLTLQFFPRQAERRIGIIGMGVGTLTTYGRPGDYIRIYEINPEVRRLAENYFTYLADSRADIDVVMGDARLSLERETSQQFDVLVVDAFTGDAIPMHLLTKEAFEEYLRHLKPDGVIAVLISTTHLDLGPVVRRLAEHIGLDAVRIINAYSSDEDWGADWMLLSRNQEFLGNDVIRAAAREAAAFMGPVRSGAVRLWTDDYSSPLLALVR